MKLTPMIMLAALAAASVASAQPQGGGGGAPSPEVQAARDAMRQACAADVKTLCDGKQGREMMMCMRDNAEKLSGPCKEAMSRMPARPARPQ
jgi:hypothetical protein